MPHFVIEHTNNVKPRENWERVFDALFTASAAKPTMMRADMKGRARRIEGAYMTDGNPDQAFVHLELALMTGRDPNMLNELGKELLAILPQVFATTAPCQYSIEMREMNRALYFKHTQ